MKKILALLLIFGAFGARAEFIDGFEEIPLMDGLYQDEGLSFDTEESRVIQQQVGAEDISAVKFVSFYKQTLASLGWSLKSESGEKLVFLREGEKLEISIEQKKPLLATFLLTPGS